MEGSFQGHAGMLQDPESQTCIPRRISQGVDDEPMTKSKLMRAANREVRRFANLPIWGKDGVMMWFVRTSWKTFLFYSLYAVGSFVFADQILEVRNNLSITSTPYLATPMQLLAAFLTGMTMSSAMTRFNSALSHLSALQNAVENFRLCLLGSTHDPKFRIASQCFLMWMTILVRKGISFYTADYSHPLQDLLDPLQSRNRNPTGDMSKCVLFKPEVLWSFDGAHFGFITRHFLSATKLAHHESNVEASLDKVISAYEAIQNLLQVHAPTTGPWLNGVTVHAWLLFVPIFGDPASRVTLPFVAIIFQAVLTLAVELNDPWGNDFHDLPLQTVMASMAAPAWTEKDQECIPEVIEWLNRGLTANVWTKDEQGYPIPRKVRRGPRFGQDIHFGEMLSLYEVAGFATWDEFMASARNDLANAKSHDRRMASYVDLVRQHVL